MSTHPTAEVSPSAEIGEGTRVWHQAQIRERARIGSNCIVGKGVYIDFDVQVGSNVKIQNGAFLYHGCKIEDGVFIGPGACFTNDRRPRAINADGSLKADGDWEVGEILVRQGASIGAGAIILPGTTVGRFALVAAGAVVGKDVPDYGLVVGVPARLIAFVCSCAETIGRPVAAHDIACPRCSRRYRITEDARGIACQPI